MANLRLAVEVRNSTGKGAGRQARREGKVPAVLYGKNVDNVDLTVDAARLQRILQSGGAGGLIELTYNDKSQVVLIKEVQADPILGRPLHVDFHAVALDEEVSVSVPIVLTGEAERASDGGVVAQNLRELTVSCLPTVIPESISVDIAQLGIGDTIVVGSLDLPEGVRTDVDPEETVVSIVLPQAAPAADDAAEEAGDEAEGSDDGAAESSEGETAD